MIPYSYKALCFSFVFSILTVSASQTYASANFQITPTPGRPLPTTVLEGKTVSAYYTITNQTLSTRSGYYIQGLPPTVQQNSSALNSCPSTITLRSKSSCILQLDISGPVSADVALCKGSTCTKSATPLAVRALPMPPFIAAGYFKQESATFSGTKPLLAASQDGGIHWNYPIAATPVLPLNCYPGGETGRIGGAQFTNSSCSGATCIAAGQCSTENSLSEQATSPFLATSNDAGRTWRYTLAPMSPSLPSACGINSVSLLNSTSCSGTQCIAVGDCGSETSTQPLLASSSNSGASWGYKTIANFPEVCKAGKEQYVSLIGSSCSEKTCIAAGLCTNKGDGTSPLIAASNDGGVSWHYALSSSTLQLPNGCLVEGIENGVFFTSASCAGTQCVASGACVTANTSQLLIATTKDGGLSWRYNSNNTVFPSAALNTGYPSTSCSGQYCVVAGSLPIVVSSSDGGVTWRNSISPSNPSLPTTCLTGDYTLNFANCSGKICVAVGNCATANGLVPLIAQSNNGGSTWNYTNASTELIPPAPYLFQNLNTVSCSGTLCIASGSIKDTIWDFPFIVSSSDGGVTWRYTLLGNTPALPKNTFDAGFYSTSSNQMKQMLPRSLHFLQSNIGY